MSSEYIYWPYIVRICCSLYNCLQDSYLELFMIILKILFWIQNILLLKGDVPQKIIPYDIIEWK